MTTIRVLQAIGWLALGVLVLWFAAVKAVGQDGHRHPASDLQQHHSFYWYLTRPDIENAQPGSCCSDGDCYVTQARLGPEGQWQALRREDRRWINIPEDRIVRRPDELMRRPTFEASLCMLSHNTVPFCFVAPEGGT